MSIMNYKETELQLLRFCEGIMYRMPRITEVTFYIGDRLFCLKERDRERNKWELRYYANSVVGGFYQQDISRDEMKRPEMILHEIYREEVRK